MPHLLPDSVDDMVNLTLSNYKRGDWVDISMEHPEYTASKIIDRKSVQERGGPDIRFKVQVRNTGNAGPTGLFAQDSTGVKDLSVEGVVNWRMQTVNWSYDILEPIFQSDRETIVSEILMREHAAMNDMAELNEQYLWSSPTSSDDDEVPYGIPFWLQKDASTTAGGAFNGGNPSGFTSGAGGISSTTYPKWKNWTFGYESVDSLDAVAKIKKSLVFTNFMAAHPHPELGFGKADYQIYTVYSVREDLELLAESRNDNLGKDVAKYINQVTVGGVPVTFVHYLNANTTDEPIYGVNWKSFRPFVKKGVNMRQTKKPSPTQRNVRQVHYDTAMNYICYNRRLQWVGSKA